MQKKANIVLSAVLIFGLISIMALITRFLWNHNSTKTTDSNDDKPQKQQISSLTFTDGLWARLFTPKRDREQSKSTISGIIKAGDEGLYTSALFNAMHGEPGDLTLEMLYDTLGHELKSRSMTERSAYPFPVSKLLPTSTTSVRRAQSLRTTREGRYEFQPRAPRTSLDLMERGLGRSKSRSAAPMLVKVFGALAYEDTQTTSLSWTHDLQQAQYFEGRTGITVTSAELAALSLIQGFPQISERLEKTEQTFTSGKGALGTSLSGTLLDDGRYHVSLKKHERSVSQLPARGSGYSTLFAKHLACGSLPYSQDKNTIKSILITTETFDALRAGVNLGLERLDLHSPASLFLVTLPSSRTSALYTLTPSPAPTSVEAPVLLLNAISSLPFTGGLTPLASTALIKTVHFVASAGLSVGRLLQRLDAMVEKVHRQAPSLHLFGPLYEPSNARLLFRERERLGRLATGAVEEDSVADRAARVQRYITLIERLIALVPGMKPQEVLSAVRDATKREIEQNYEAAVTAFRNGDVDAEVGMGATGNKRHSTTSMRSTRRSKRSSSSSFAAAVSSAPALVTPPTLQDQITPPNSPSLPSPRSSITFPTHNLGRQVEQLLKVSLPLDVESIARLVRLVIAAWTVSVEAVDKSSFALGFEGIEKMVFY